MVHGTITYMFDCWADPVVHLLLLKSSMLQQIGFTPPAVTLVSFFHKKKGKSVILCGASD